MHSLGSLHVMRGHNEAPQSDAEALRRRGREEFLARLVAHSDEFKAFHRDARRAGGRLSKAVIADFDSKAKRESKERDRAQRERLRALRENNIDEYMKLVTETKNERLTQLLEETDGYLRELGAKIEEQKRELIAAAAPADSYDISDMLLGPSKSRTKHSARSQLLVSNPQGGSFSVCLRLGSLKLIISTPRVQCVLGTRCDVPTVTEEMYNLAADLGEAHDLLKGDSRGCVEALREQCEHHAFKSAHENMESCAETSRALCVRRRVITAGFHGDVLVAHFLHQRLNMPNATST